MGRKLYLPRRVWKTNGTLFLQKADPSNPPQVLAKGINLF
jgi:hypothetical protein